MNTHAHSLFFSCIYTLTTNMSRPDTHSAQQTRAHTYTGTRHYTHTPAPGVQIVLADTLCNSSDQFGKTRPLKKSHCESKACLIEKHKRPVLNRRLRERGCDINEPICPSASPRVSPTIGSISHTSEHSSRISYTRVERGSPLPARDPGGPHPQTKH